jgi:SPP1 gp7 family putative phage head morphogenesis protein
MSSNNALIDAITLRQILIERYSKGEAKKLVKNLTRLSRQLKKTVNSDYGRVRAVRLAQQVTRITETILNEYGDEMIVGLKEFGKDEAEFIEQALLATTAAEAVSSGSIRQIQASITKVPMKLISGKKTQTLTIEQAARKFSKKKSLEIAQLIRDGSVVGKTTQDLGREIEELVGGKFTREAESLVRTTTNHIGTQARNATYAANDDVIIGEEFLATLDSITSVTCASLDGRIFPIGEGPMPPVHWNCRSDRVPKVNPEFDLGSEIVGERASIDGPVSGQTTYGGFLKRQNAAVQNEVLGVERAKLFRSGKLSIGKFTDDSGKVYNLQRLRELNPLAFNSASST